MFDDAVVRAKLLFFCQNDAKAVNVTVCGLGVHWLNIRYTITCCFCFSSGISFEISPIEIKNLNSNNFFKIGGSYDTH